MKISEKLFKCKFQQTISENETHEKKDYVYHQKNYEKKFT
jgi:hypothetical protein